MASDNNNDRKNQNGGAVEPPLVEIARYRVQPGSLEKWDEEIKRREAECRKRDGFSEFVVLRPNDGSNEDAPPSNAGLRVVTRFSSGEKFTQWEESDARKQSDERLEPLLQGPVDTQILTGIETFHTASGQATIVAPSRHKVSLLNWLALFPVALAISYITTLLFGKDFPIVPKTLILSLCLVPLTNYLIMPNMTKLAAKWLYPTPK